MTQKELLATIRRYKGKIYGAVLGANDVYYIQLVKADLLEIVANVSDNQLTADERHGALYIDRAL